MSDDYRGREDRESWGANDPGEVIDAREVELIVSVLDDLIERIDSDTLKVYLHATCEDVSRLIALDDEHGDDLHAA